MADGNCPTKENKHTWSQYFLGKYPGGRPFPIAGVDFAHAAHALKAEAEAKSPGKKKAIKDSIDIGFNDVTSCYRILYRPAAGAAGPKGWHSHRDTKSPHYSSSRGPTAAEQAALNADLQLMEGGPGDPGLRQISVSGTLFSFDDQTGELRDKHGHKVAQLECAWRYTPCGQ
ncbi:acid sphingomyelinase-like phosphodiesterase 3b [Bradyrhizobium oligotrophicum S58]|uniref:Acid sphingomyelinase-like phosphodiesterase 3b n=1 Tax=Bradyrhizobium oligotrophicum S58 TaxID=1245469 RepID=M4ZGE8_9BRAD|nr:hypothetical protein [Bradyrhizobium oligotrophicum]BAM92883.1 acid sphingomyelinase-like phosphodiesterase 3b [Bradyrhizobium oligotrophicum S58]